MSTEGNVGTVQVDSIYQGKANGTIAARLLVNNMDVNCLRTNTNDALLHEEWIAFDTAVIDAFQSRIVGVQDLIDANLVYDMKGKGMASSVLAYEAASKSGNAVLSMDGMGNVQLDNQEFSTAYLPLPIIHCDYQMSARFIAESRNRGIPADTSAATQAALRVAEKVESILFAGASSYKFGGGYIRGYCDYDNRQTVTLSTYGAWSASGVTGAQILAGVQAMKAKMITAKCFGPYGLYIPTAYETIIDNDYSTLYPSVTIKDRLLKIGGMQFVHVSDSITAANVVMVQLKPNTVQLVMGLSPTNVDWETNGGLMLHRKVMCIMVPKFGADFDGNCGIVHMS